MTWARVGARLTAVSWRRVACFAAPPLILLLLPVVGLAYHVFFDRSGLPDIEPFIRFTPPTIGEVYDARGTVLIQLAREYRRVVSYDEVPPVLRHAILSAEDKHFFTHSGVDYRALPRVLQKTAARSLAAWWNGDAGLRMLLGQGGSTLTQQLVRGYFLQHLTRREGADVLVRGGLTPRLLSTALGVPATNKLLRKLEEVRLALWLEAEMRRHYGSQDRAKREIFARYASFIYLGHGRYGFAAGSEYYFGKPLSSYGPEDAGQAAVLAGITKSPRDYAPVPGDPRPLRRRNQILALMARNGYIPEDLATRSQAEPIRVAAAQRGEDPRPRGDRARLRRAEAPRRRALRGRGLGAGADLGPLHGGRARPDHRQRGPGDRPRALRAAPPDGEGADPGLRGGAAQRGRGDPGRGGRPAGLPGPLHPLLRLQPRHRLAAPAGLGVEAARSTWPRSARASTSTPRCPTSPSACPWAPTAT